MPSTAGFHAWITGRVGGIESDMLGGIDGTGVTKEGICFQVTEKTL